MKKNALPISIVLTGFIISLAIYHSVGIDFLQKIFTIIGSLSLVVAAGTYFYNKKKDVTLATIEQVVFFREEIIPKSDSVQKLIKEKDPKYWFSRIKIDDDNIKSIRKEFSRNFDNQLAIFFSNAKPNNFPFFDKKILDEQIFLLNMLEEFSLRVDHLNTKNHPALNSVQAVFVSMVEQNAVALLFVRDVVIGNPIYTGIFLLYNSWKEKVKKPNYIKNLNTHGFISNKEMKNILKKQREKALKKTDIKQNLIKN